MHTSFNQSNNDDTPLAAERRRLVAHILTSLASEIPRLHPAIAIFLIGSSVDRTAWSPKDLDLLLIDTEAEGPKNTNNLQHLFECMRCGDAFAGSFDATDIKLSGYFKRLIQGAVEPGSKIQINTSFAFGPTQGEVNIPDAVLHVHVAGPLVKADLQILNQLFPFHALGFLTQHKHITGLPLTSLLPKAEPLISDLIIWDQLLLRRFDKALTNAGRIKWLKRLIQNRQAVPAYAAEHSAWLDDCLEAIESADRDEMRVLITRLIESAKEAATSVSPRSRAQ